jgi:cytochrome c-type biogenesis protein CcmF
MIAEAGLAALWLAAGLAALQVALMLVALRGDVAVARPMRAVAVVQGVLTLVSFTMLLLVFARTDLSVALVFENSHSAKPFVYKVAGAWGNHEGSMLLWVAVLSAAGALMALLSRRLNERTLLAGLGALAALALGFYAFLLVASNPFARLDPAPIGAGASTRCCRIPASPSIHRPCTSAMSGFRWRSAWRSARFSPGRWTRSSHARCGRGCSAHGCS